MKFFKKLINKFKDARDDDANNEAITSGPSAEVVSDVDAVQLSYIGKAAYEVLRNEHSDQHESLWNVTVGTVVGELDATPKHVPFDHPNAIDPEDDMHHSDWFPYKIGELLEKTQVWADVMSLSPPDGLFMDVFQNALSKIAQRGHRTQTKITVRMMFGNIIGMPVNCNNLINKLTEKIPEQCQEYIQIWVGAWRKGVSWNHAKIIAIDGIHLCTGGHNLWDYHYLKDSPVHDLSITMKGIVAHDGHLFANDQWEFVESTQETIMGKIIDVLPDQMLLAVKTRVAVSEFPKDRVPTFPPAYSRSAVVAHRGEDEQQTSIADSIPIITMGRYGTILKEDRPADDAFIAMFRVARKSIRLVLQDLGPVCIPKTKRALPGCVWPKEYLSALGEAIYERHVDVEIILSNPNSIPGGLSATEANYGNGWSCVEVAAELIQTMKENHPDATDEKLRQVIHDNVRICFVRRSLKHKTKWEKTKLNIGLHSKFFMIDDRAAYIGSQNLYICDLAEWGVVIDDPKSVKQIKDEYWTPMYKASYNNGVDVNVQEVMDNLGIDRNGEHINDDDQDAKFKAQCQANLQQMGMGCGKIGKKFCKRFHKDNADLYDSEEE